MIVFQYELPMKGGYAEIPKNGDSSAALQIGKNDEGIWIQAEKEHREGKMYAFVYLDKDKAQSMAYYLLQLAGEM